MYIVGSSVDLCLQLVPTSILQVLYFVSVDQVAEFSKPFPTSSFFRREGIHLIYRGTISLCNTYILFFPSALPFVVIFVLVKKPKEIQAILHV